MKIHDFDCVDLKGKPFPLRQFTGQALLIVNTASQCKFTPQYKRLETIWQHYRDRGLTVIGMPSNDFGNQEPGDSDAISSFCEINYGVTFPLLQKAPVTGSDAHPLFKELTRQGGFLSKPRWNFYKYVVGRDGQVQDWFASSTTPDSARMTKALEKAINA